MCCPFDRVEKTCSDMLNLDLNEANSVCNMDVGSIDSWMFSWRREENSCWCLRFVTLVSQAVISRHCNQLYRTSSPCKLSYKISCHISPLKYYHKECCNQECILIHPQKLIRPFNYPYFWHFYHSNRSELFFKHSEGITIIISAHIWHTIHF